MQPGSAHFPYREYAAVVEDGIRQSRFEELLSEYYITFKGKHFEVKGNPNGIDASPKRISISSRPLSKESEPADRISILVMRKVFRNYLNWKLAFRFSVNDMVVPEDIIDRQDPKNGPEPLFFTFSDNAHAGFIVIWPEVLQYYDLGPVVGLREQWVLDREISDRPVSLALTKDALGSLKVRIDQQSFSVRMAGDRISAHNYEIPPFVRYAFFNLTDNFHEAHFSKRFDLTGRTAERQYKRVYSDSRTRDFVRFGVIYYGPMPETFVDLTVHDVHVDTRK
jgi:hypothetical protein